LRRSSVRRKQRHGIVGDSWYVDETYIKVQGRWCYLYRAIDRDGHLIDARLSDNRDLYLNNHRRLSMSEHPLYHEMRWNVQKRETMAWFQAFNGD
jgi:transposase-like protein